MKRNKQKFKILKFFNKSRTNSSGRKRRIFASAVLAGNLFFGNLKPNDIKTNTTPLSHEKVISNQQNQPSEALKSALKIRSRDSSKTGPGARARADARRNAKAGKYSSGSTIIPGAD